MQYKPNSIQLYCGRNQLGKQLIAFPTPLLVLLYMLKLFAEIRIRISSAISMHINMQATND